MTNPSKLDTINAMIVDRHRAYMRMVAERDMYKKELIRVVDILRRTGRNPTLRVQLR